VEDVGIGDVESQTAGALLLDVREPEEYARGHLPGAVSLPQAELASRLDELPRDRPILVVCESGSRSRRSAQFLTQMGFARVANISGGTHAWRKAGKPLERPVGVPIR
jgi:rhodanese-related sulfurtransferase